MARAGSEARFVIKILVPGVTKITAGQMELDSNAQEMDTNAFFRNNFSMIMLVTATWERICVSHSPQIAHQGIIFRTLKRRSR